MSREGQESHIAMRKTRLTNPLVLPGSPFQLMKPKSNRGPGQPKKGNVRFTAHITPATHKRILSRQKDGQTLGQVIDSAFTTEPTNKV